MNPIALAAVIRQNGGEVVDVINPQPLHVLHVLPGFGLGGCERIVAELVRKLPSRGVRSSVCVLGTRAECVHWLGAEKPWSLGQSGGIADYRSTSRTLRRLRQLIAKLKPNMVHTHLWPADFIGAMAIRGSGIPHVSHQHGTSEWWRADGLRPALRRMLTRRLMRRSGARFIAVSEAVARHIERPLRLTPGAIQVIHNGVDVTAFAPMPMQRRAGQRRIIAAAGRFSPEKGFDRLVHAVGTMVKGGREVELHLAGAGSQEERYRQLAEQFGIADRLTIAGQVHDMRRFYANADIVALPSLAAEGLPLTMLEAMAMARPVVATRIGGAAEAITDGMDGLLVPPNDVPALAAALTRLASDADLAARLAAAARRRIVSDFDLDHTVQRIVSFYRALLPA